MYDAAQVYELLKQFIIPETDAQKGWLIKAERLTPDSEAYAVLANYPNMSGKFYVLYSEDYIESLGYIKKVIEDWFACKVQEFVKPKSATKFEDSPGSRYYTNPNKSAIAEWEPYALPDNSYYTFLAVVEPTASNQSFWVRTRQINNKKEIPPEIQELVNQTKPIDPNKSFLDTWQEKNSIDEA
jgi:hypothetical protein